MSVSFIASSTSISSSSSALLTRRATRRKSTTKAPLSLRASRDGTDSASVSSPAEPTLGRSVGFSRRAMLAGTTSFSFAAACVGEDSPAYATSNGVISDAWERVVGAEADLRFPDVFEGNWLAVSRTVRVEAPQGMDLIRDKSAFGRLSAETAKDYPAFNYPVRFTRNSRGDVVFDRAFNVRALAEASASGGKGAVDGEIEWDIDDPNVLRLTTQDGLKVFYKVTARSLERDDDARSIVASELAQVVLDRPDSPNPTVKSTRIVTKYKWRTPKEAGDGPTIVATQTVYEYLTALSGDDDAFIRSAGKPVEIDAYRIAMSPWPL